MRLSPIEGLPAADVVGGSWTRTNVPEIAIVGADTGPVAHKIAYAGTIKWLDRQPIDQSDANALLRTIIEVPGADASTPLLAVSRNGVSATGAFAAALGPDDLIEAW